MSSTVGGRVELSLNGRPYNPVADVEIDEANFEPEAVDNQDGTVGRTVKSGHYEVDIKFRHKPGFTITDLMSSVIDFSMRELDTRQVILMSNCFLVGKPKRNTTNGEISGMKIASDNLQKIPF